MIYSVDSFPGRTILVEGKEYLYFGGTSYLGLQTDATFQELFINNIKKYGTNYGASRKANVQISVFQEVEEYLAHLVGSSGCVTLSSGYLAGKLVAQTLNTSKHQFFYAPEVHSALDISEKTGYDTFDDLDKAIRIHLRQKASTPVVLMDSIYISGEGYPDFAPLRRLPMEDIILVVDDSHGIGIVGAGGCGAYEKAKTLNPKELVVCASLGKGYGIQSGAIFGTKTRIEEIRKTKFFGGASPAAPAALASLIEGESIFEEKRKILKQNIQLFLSELRNPAQLNHHEDYPAYYFSNPQIASFLEKNKILITNFKYPNEHSPLMSRIVISATHTRKDIIHLSKMMNLS